MANFVDTNVLLYAASTTPGGGGQAFDRTRHPEAGRPGAVGTGTAGVLRAGDPAHETGSPAHQQAVALIESWLRFRIIETSVALVRQALATAERWRISYWDAALVEAARLAGCPAVYTADLQDGMELRRCRGGEPVRGARPHAAGSLISHHGHSVTWKTMKTVHGPVHGGRHFRISMPGSAAPPVPCMGVTSHLLTSVPEIERHVAPHGELGAFLATRFKETRGDHCGWQVRAHGILRPDSPNAPRLRRFGRNSATNA